MKRRLIEWVRRRPGHTVLSHQAIRQLGGTAEDGTPWSLTTDELIHTLRYTNDVYLVRVGGRFSVLEVCLGPEEPFLRCWYSDHWVNDLLLVPERDPLARR